VHAADTATRGVPGAVVAVARCRALPDPEVLSSYTSCRLAAPDIRGPLTEQFCAALGGAAAVRRSVATYSRVFARYGPFTARDWRALACLAYELCLHQSNAHARLGNWRHGCAPPISSLRRTVDRYARDFLGLSFGAATTRLGWEWVLELALRRGRYIDGTAR
jgi:hypothetical protein